MKFQQNVDYGDRRYLQFWSCEPSDCAQHPTTTITAPKQSSWEEERTSTGMVHALLFVIKVERVALFPLSCLVFALRARW